MQGCIALTKGQEPLSATPFKSEERRIKAASGSTLTHAIQAFALRVPLASKSAPDRFVF